MITILLLIYVTTVTLSKIEIRESMKGSKLITSQSGSLHL